MIQIHCSTFVSLLSLIQLQVGDFGLSRFKANTFISSKSVAGTVSFIFLCSNSQPHTKFTGFLPFECFCTAARMDGTRISPRRAIQREVWCLQLRCDLVGAPDNAATVEWPRSCSGNVPSLNIVLLVQKIALVSDSLIMVPFAGSGSRCISEQKASNS